jgi:hypothetical protein
VPRQDTFTATADNTQRWELWSWRNRDITPGVEMTLSCGTRVRFSHAEIPPGGTIDDVAVHCFDAQGLGVTTSWPEVVTVHTKRIIGR